MTSTVKRLTADVAVIGAGLVGSAAALALRRAGLSVILLDKGFTGSQASGVNYGGVRRQGRSLEQLPLSQRAHKIWPHLPELIGTDGEYSRSGHLKIARTEADFAQLETYAESARPYGLDLELISSDAVKDRFPWLSGKVAGASLCHEDGHANPRLVAAAYANAAGKAGAQVLDHMAVKQVEVTGSGFAILAQGSANTALRNNLDETVEITCTTVINSAGAWADQFAELFKEPVPLTRIYPSMVVTEPLPLRLPLSIGEEGGGFYGRQVTRGNYVMGGGRGIVLDDPDYSRPSVLAAAEVMQRAIELFPHLENAQVIRFWSGTEAEMADGNPVIGPSSTTPGLFHAFGFCGAGFQTGPAVGEILSELITNGETPTSIKEFSINRFQTAAGQGTAHG